MRDLTFFVIYRLITLIFNFSVSILRNNSRYRRDQRQLDEEEEIWFNEDEDFTDKPNPELDSSLGKCSVKLVSHYGILEQF